MDEDALFAAALEKNDLAERDAFLDEACDGNSSLRAEVQELLEAGHTVLPAGRDPARVAESGAQVVRLDITDRAAFATHATLFHRSAPAQITVLVNGSRKIPTIRITPGNPHANA